MDHTTSVRSELASIIVPCWNQLEFTRQCIAALMRCTRSPWELIVVNNGSTDGTGDYLAGVQDASAVPVTVVANSTNLGFPAAVNQGLKCARGEHLVLLNNDAVVTEGWLEQMIALGRTVPGSAEPKWGRGTHRVVGQAFEPDVSLERLTYVRAAPSAGAPSDVPGSPGQTDGARFVGCQGVPVERRGARWRRDHPPDPLRP